MKQKYKDGHTVVGYIAREEIASGFLNPIYRNNKELFTHILTGNHQRIQSFKLLIKVGKKKKDPYAAVRGFTPYGGPQKAIYDPSFVVFKHYAEITFASCDDEAFLEKLSSILPTLPTDTADERLLCTNIEKLLKHIPEEHFKEISEV